MSLKNPLPSINGIRGISILLVILHHLNVQYGIFSYVYTNKSLAVKPLLAITNLICDGHLGVNIFFVISGFLITYLLINEEQEKGKINIKKFFIRRTFRIFPAYYFMLLVYLVLQRIQLIDLTPASWLTSFTYTKYLNWNLDWFTSHAWSLSIEEQFYLLWPFTFYFFKRKRKFLLWGIVAVVPFLRLAGHHYELSWISELSLFYRIDAIAFGCLLAFYKDHLLNLSEQRAWQLFIVSLLVIVSITSAMVPLSKWAGLEAIWIPLGTTNGSLANIAIAFVLFYSVYRAKGWYYRLFNSKVLSTIGIYSYSIYLWQQLFTYPELFPFPINVLCIFAAAFFSYHVVEQPMLKIKDRIGH